MSFQLRVLGPAEVFLPDGKKVPLSLGKPLAVLVYVALSPQPPSRDEVASIFWPDAPREKALHSLRQALWVLKTALGQDLFDGEGSLTLRRGILGVDVHRFRQALQDGRIADARALWRGIFLEGFAIPSSRQWENWVQDFRSDLERRFQQGLLARALELRRSEAPEEALTQLQTAVELNPASEAVQRARIEILLELLRLGEAREAMADAWGAVGDHPGAREWLQEMERRLEAVVRERRREGQEAEGLTLEFVGRSRELALLRRAYEEAVADRTRVVVVTGVAGIGKTRLAEEFLRGTAGEDTLRVVVKGSRAEMKLRWGGVARLVRQLLLLPGSAGISSASDSLLRAMIPSLGRDTVNLDTVNGVSPVALLDAVRDLLEAVSFEAPLVVHLDDLQWFDAESRALFLSLLARPGSFRTLFVITGRPDLSSSNWKSLQDSLVGDAGAEGLTLEALDLGEVRELLALMAEFSDPEEGEALVHRIHRASGGNPLFLRGLLQQLSDQGVIHGTEDGSWVLDTGALSGEFSFPEDIRALLNERLDRLSPEGALLAGVLARHGRPMAPVDLQMGLGDGHGKPADAVAELLEREVVRWVDEEALDFCHDLLREAALEHLRFASPPSGPNPGRRRPWTRPAGAILAAGVLLAVPLSLMWGRGSLGLGEEPAPPPFGGGTLVMAQAESSPVAFEVSAGPPEDWAPHLLEAAPEGRVTEAHRGPEGSVVLYGVMDLPLGPDMLRYLPDGSSRALFPADGDQALLDVSPEGERVLFRSQDMTIEGFSVDLYWGVPETGESHLLHRGNGLTIGDARWSGDGDLVAFMIQTRVDTLAVSALTGERVASRPMPEVRSLSWCKGDLVAMAGSGEDLMILRVSVPEMGVDTVAVLQTWSSVTCSPDGRGLVYFDVSGTERIPVLQDLESGEVHPLPTQPGPFREVFWLPPRPSPIPMAVRAGADTVRIPWGERRRLSANVLYSDDSLHPEGIRWESLNPSVATVTPDRELTANGAGTTRVLARWGHSLVDTVWVEVEDRGTGGALLRERFTRLDPARWIPFGDPEPRVEIMEGEPVLRLLGDEKYRQGILFRSGLPLEQGATVEAEFRMDPNRNVHQNFHLCLSDLSFEEVDLEMGRFHQIRQTACFSYPARESEKMDPSEASLSVGYGAEKLIRLPPALPPRNWTHVAVQVRADGQVALVVNREVVAVSPLRIRIQPEGRWTVMVEGDAIGTELLVRNLVIWKEVRYGGPEGS